MFGCDNIEEFKLKLFCHRKFEPILETFVRGFIPSGYMETGGASTVFETRSTVYENGLISWTINLIENGIIGCKEHISEVTEIDDWRAFDFHLNFTYRTYTEFRSVLLTQQSQVDGIRACFYLFTVPSVFLPSGAEHCACKRSPGDIESLCS